MKNFLSIFNKCKHCSRWVTSDNSTGFCVVESLYTYTHKFHCEDYIKGNPITTKEFEEFMEDE